MFALLVFSLSLSVNSLKELNIYRGQETQIDIFDKFGLVINNTLIDLGNNVNQPCHLTPQSIVTKSTQNNMIDIIPEFKESQFRKSFENGHFKGKIPEILSMVQSKQGIILLTNQGDLIYLEESKDGIKEMGRTTLKYQQEIYRKPVYMVFVNDKKTLIIIFHGMTVGIELDLSNTNKQFSTSFSIYEYLDTSKINSITVVGNMLFIAYKQYGVYMFKLEDKRLEQVITKEINLQNVMDFKIFNKYSDFYFIYVLDADIGVKQYIYNAKDTKIKENTDLGIIPFGGNIMDIHLDILMIVQPKEYESNLIEIKINYKENTWQLIKNHTIQRDIQDIDIIDGYAIILGTNGHQIITHSLPKDIYINLNSSLIIPSLQILEFRQNQHTLVGISRHNFFYTTLYIQPAQIICQSDGNDKQIKLLYQQYSTKCLQQQNKIDQTCSFEQEYIINVLTPWITSESTYLIYILTGIIVIGFIIVIIYLIKEFRKYQEFMYRNLVDYESIVQPKSNEVTINTFDSPTKFSKLSHSRLPRLQLQE